MKIAIIGYGKMGHAIERIALTRGHEIVCTIDAAQDDRYDTPAFASADAAIEFTAPSTALANVVRALDRGVPVVCGSTGWAPAGLPQVREITLSRGGSFMWSSNYSLGVNLFFKINAMTARLMDRFDSYRPAMKETHHVHKLDHPSGTAVSLATDIIGSVARVDRWTEDGARAAADPSAMLIEHERVGEVPGTHTVTWSSPIDIITLEHRALSRDGFALGAVIAAEWLAANPGYHTMDEMMDALTAR